MKHVIVSSIYNYTKTWDEAYGRNYETCHPSCSMGHSHAKTVNQAFQLEIHNNTLFFI